MTYQRHSYIFYGLISLLSFVRVFVVRVFSLAAVPVLALIRSTPAPVLRIFQPLKLIAYRAIKLLKPVYRDSQETHGLSLTSVRD